MGMENVAILLIVIALFLLAIILGLLTLLVFRLLKQPQSLIAGPPEVPKAEVSHPDVSRTEFHPEILERMKTLEKIKPKRSDLFCPNHSEEPGEVTCAICDKLYCKACIKPFKTMHFCKEHLPLVMRHDWDEVLTLKTSTSDTEQGVRLYDIKKEMFEKNHIPTYIETHYKINVDQDYIETYLVLFAIKENVASVRDKLENHSLLP